jgi:hypothetical protein
VRIRIAIITILLALSCYAIVVVMMRQTYPRIEERKVSRTFGSRNGGRVEVLDFEGTCRVEQEDELLARLRSVRRGTDGAFILDTAFQNGLIRLKRTWFRGWHRCGA